MDTDQVRAELGARRSRLCQGALRTATGRGRPKERQPAGWKPVLRQVRENLSDRIRVFDFFKPNLKPSDGRRVTGSALGLVGL